MKAFVTPFALGAGIFLSSSAAFAAPVDDLVEVLRFDELMEVMRAEGLASSDEMLTGMGLRADAPWRDRVGQIYDVDAMQEVLTAALGDVLDEEAVPEIVAFFSSQPGRDFLGWELAAREALLDADVEESARTAAAQALAADTPRINLIADYIAANDIIESNVMGGMNGSYAFYRGMRAGGALPAELTDDLILQDVWQQEDQLRANTTDWAYSYLFLAYAPADDAALDAYIAFSRSDAGQEMTSSLFSAFDVLFNTMSEAMGLAVAQRMAMQEL